MEKKILLLFTFALELTEILKQEKEKNMKILLLLKNYSKIPLDYTSEIQQEENGEFQNTSNVGAYPNVKTMEMWPYMIYSIGLREFRKSKIE